MSLKLRSLALYFEIWETSSKCIQNIVQINPTQPGHSRNAKNQAFTNFLKEKEQNPKCRGLTLFSFLIKPVQRICKYPLFLREFIRATPEDTSEYKIFSEAQTKIEDVVEFINARKRENEMNQKIFDIQNNIEELDSPIVDPRRRYIKEGDVLLRYGESDKKQIDCKLFLFNDLLLFAKKNKGKKLPLLFQSKVAISAKTKYVVCVDTCQISEGDHAAMYFRCENGSVELNQWVSEIRTLTRPFQVKKFQVTAETQQKSSKQ